MSTEKQRVLAFLAEGRLPEAKRLCAQLCPRDGRDVEALLMLASIHAREGALDQVLECCRRILAIDPDNPHALYNSAVAAQGSGFRDQAESTYRRLLQLQPDNASALGNLGVLLMERGELDESIRLIETAVALAPRSAEMNNNLGLALLAAGRDGQAANCFEEAIRIKPSLAEAHFNLGLCRQKSGQGAQTIASFRQAVSRKPDYASAWYRLGQTLRDRSNNAEAVACYRRALTIRNDYPECSYELVLLLAAGGNYEEAMSILRQLLDARPEDPDLLAAAASVHEFRGDRRIAQELLRPWIGRSKPSLKLAVVYARCVETAGEIRDAIARLEEFLAQDKWSKHDRRDALYMLGQLCDNQADYDKAFTSIRSANELEEVAVDLGDIEQEFDLLMQVFNKDLPAQVAYRGNPSTRPVFIVGMPRSGTTLVEQVLASHSRMYGAGELDDMGRIVSRLRQQCAGGTGYPRCLANPDRKLLDELAAAYLHKLDSLAPSAERVIDKMPHNFLALGLIDMLFPGARVIHCYRDPRDTCLSIYFHHFTQNHPYASDLRALGRYYRLYHELMRHWTKVLRLSIFDLSYEQLVVMPEETATKLVECCGLNWEPGCLDFHESRRVVTTPTYCEVRQPVHDRSVGRWKNYEKHLTDLFDGLGQREWI